MTDKWPSPPNAAWAPLGICTLVGQELAAGGPPQPAEIVYVGSLLLAQYTGCCQLLGSSFAGLLEKSTGVKLCAQLLFM
jgi:hypothetical protein